jgi:hypothetical protein
MYRAVVTVFVLVKVPGTGELQFFLFFVCSMRPSSLSDIIEDCLSAHFQAWQSMARTAKE